MSAFEDARVRRPVACCRERANLETVVVPATTAGEAVCERCIVCGRKHYGVRLRAGVHGVAPGRVGEADGDSG